MYYDKNLSRGLVRFLKFKNLNEDLCTTYIYQNDDVNMCFGLAWFAFIAYQPLEVI